MGKKYRDWVRANSKQKRSPRAVLNVLADFAKDEDGTAFPGYETLADATGLSERTIMRCISSLIADGDLRYVEGGLGRGKVSGFQIVIAKGDRLSPFEAEEKVTTAEEKVTVVQEKVTTVQEKGDNGDIDTIYRTVLEPYIEPREEPREDQPVVVDLQSPPSSSLKPGEYLPGIADPRKQQHWRKEHVAISEHIKAAASLGISPEQFRLITDAVLIGCGRKALADAGDERTLNHAQETAIILARMAEQFRTPAGVDSIFASWQVNDYRGETPPTSQQLREHASLILSGGLNKKGQSRHDRRSNAPAEQSAPGHARPDLYAKYGWSTTPAT